MTVPPRSTSRFAIEPAVGIPGDPSRELLRLGPNAFPWFFVPDRAANYPPAKFTAAWENGKLSIEAKSFLRDVCVFVDRLDPQASVSDQLITLLPGESFTFEIASKLPLTLEQLTSPPVFRSVNPFGAKAL